MRCCARWRRPSAREAATTGGRPGTSSRSPTSTGCFSVDGKVMVVTGGGRGIGAATARLAAARGYRVCINYFRDEKSAAALASDIGGLAVQGDVASEPDVVRLFKTVDEKLGCVSVLVNNAGIVDRGTRVEAMSAARIQRMLAVNVTGSFLCAR